MNNILSHEDAPCFNSLLIEVDIIYFVDVVLSQTLKADSQQVPVDEDVLRESLEVNKKSYQ